MSNENTNVRKSLKDRAKEFAVQLPLMEGRTKGETKELIGQICTITDYGFMTGDTGEAYVAFTVAERPGKFYFGGTVLTDRMSQLEADGYHDEIVLEGLPVLMTEKKNRDGKRTYTNVEFYPE